MSTLHCTACRRATSRLLSRALFKVAARVLQTLWQEPGRVGCSSQAYVGACLSNNRAAGVLDVGTTPAATAVKLTCLAPELPWAAGGPAGWQLQPLPGSAGAASTAA